MSVLNSYPPVLFMITDFICHTHQSAVSTFAKKILPCWIFFTLIPDFNIFSIGDSALTIDLGNHIHETLNDRALAIQQWLLNNPFEGMRDVVVSYSSVSVYYDPLLIKIKYHFVGTAFDWVKTKVEEAQKKSVITEKISGSVINIPVCYDTEFGVDLDFVASEKSISVEEVIRLHISTIYRVYMIGFLPGFSYMGILDDALAIPRKPVPVPVAAGSVGMAGKQTGIYPSNSPGGWQIIGRTPLIQFDASATMQVKLQTGDNVCFYPITRLAFENGDW